MYNKFNPNIGLAKSLENNEAKKTYDAVVALGKNWRNYLR